MNEYIVNPYWFSPQELAVLKKLKNPDFKKHVELRSSIMALETQLNYPAIGASMAAEAYNSEEILLRLTKNEYNILCQAIGAEDINEELNGKNSVIQKLCPNREQV